MNIVSVRFLSVKNFLFERRKCMCGIIGYIGDKSAVDILVDGLKKMEYRGYDSAGVAYFSNSGLKVVKSAGRLDVLEKKLAKMPEKSTCGIGHTRWATHGVPSDANAHPHSSGKITLVHNGIIENYIYLREDLISKGYTFLSDTDTEVAAHLIDSYYEGNLHAAVRRALSVIKGAYSFCVVANDDPTRIIATRKDSPLIIGLGDGDAYVASDMTALLKYTRDYYLLEEGEIAEITSDKITVWDETDTEIEKPSHHADWDVEAVDKNGYDHFMLKEIYETPTILRRLISEYLDENSLKFSDMKRFNSILNKTRRMVIVACGSANYVGCAAKYFIEAECGVEVTVEAASEFRYRNPVLREGDLIVAISQSGETADTLAAIRLAKQRGYPVLAVVNVPGSSIAREADVMLYTNAGPEIAVATTKAFSAQLAVMYLLAMQFGIINGRITPSRLITLAEQFKRLPVLCEEVLESIEACRSAAKILAEAENVFFIGRGIDYALALEGSLKLKEISYIHSEAFSAGELKHGPISLITTEIPTVAIATQKPLTEKMLSNIKEVDSRGGKVIVICKESDKEIFAGCTAVIGVPEVDDFFVPSLSIIILQTVAYFAALERGCDIDKPRNLAKSVTVE